MSNYQGYPCYLYMSFHSLCYVMKLKKTTQSVTEICSKRTIHDINTGGWGWHGCYGLGGKVAICPRLPEIFSTYRNIIMFLNGKKTKYHPYRGFSSKDILKVQGQR